MKKKSVMCGALLALALSAAGSANADIIFQKGNNPQTNEENVLFNAAGTVSGPSHTVTGITSQSNTFVAFESSENLLTPANGQARVGAQDGAFRDLSIYLLGGSTFGDLIFNLNTANNQTGVAQITVHRLSGADATYDFNVANGENFLTIFATGTDRINKVDIKSNINIDDGRQFRISDVEGPTNVPEPATVSLVVAGLLGMRRMRRKSRN